MMATDRYTKGCCMTLRSGCSLILIMFTALCTHVRVVGMDVQSAPDESWLMGLNVDTFKQVLISSDVDHDTAIIYWTRWRQVCKAWRAILTYEYMADQTSLCIAAETDQEIEPYLTDAVRNGKKGLIGLLCRLYPSISKESALRILIVPVAACALAHDKTPGVFRTLLRLGAPVDARFSYYDEDHLKITATLLEGIIRGDGPLLQQERDTCFDLLLEYNANTKHERLLESASMLSSLYSGPL